MLPGKAPPEEITGETRRASATAWSKPWVRIAFLGGQLQAVVGPSRQLQRGRVRTYPGEKTELAGGARKQLEAA